MSEKALSPFWDNLFRPKPSAAKRIAEAWAATPLFHEVPRREIQRLAAHMHPRRYAPEETVFRAGDLGMGAALILSGEVEVRVDATRITSLRPGDFFGEVALVAEEERTADVVALTEVELVFFLRNDLQEWLDRRPRLGARVVVNLAGVLAERLRYANRQVSQRKRQTPCEEAATAS